MPIRDAKARALAEVLLGKNASTLPLAVALIQRYVAEDEQAALGEQLRKNELIGDVHA